MPRNARGEARRASRRGPLAVLLAASVLLAAAVGGCGAAGPTTVTISGNQLHPETLRVSVGSTVTWINQDESANTITSDGVNTDTTFFTKPGPGQFNSGPLNPGQSFKFTFDKAGTYKYASAVNGYIMGTVVVQ